MATADELQEEGRADSSHQRWFVVSITLTTHRIRPLLTRTKRMHHQHRPPQIRPQVRQHLRLNLGQRRRHQVVPHRDPLSLHMRQPHASTPPCRQGITQPSLRVQLLLQGIAQDF